MRELEDRARALLRALDATGALLDDAARGGWLDGAPPGGDGDLAFERLRDRMGSVADSLDEFLESLIAARLRSRVHGLRRVRAVLGTDGAEAGELSPLLRAFMVLTEPAAQPGRPADAG